MQVHESTLPPLHKAYLNIFFFGVRMLATNVISFTFYSILVPMILLVYATEDLEASVHHRFMPWWAIVWMPLLVTMSTMAFTPSAFHYMVLYVMYENAMSILKLGASLEGLLGLQGSMTWTVTQKLGAAQSFDFQKMLKNLAVFPRELVVAFFLMGAALYGHSVGASWVFTVYFFTQGLIFLVFSLSLVEAVNLQPPPEAKLLGIEQLKPWEVRTEREPATQDAEGTNHNLVGGTPRAKRSKVGARFVGSDCAADHEGNAEVEGLVSGSNFRATRPAAPRPPSLLRVLYANAIIFIYTLPINAFSMLLLYGITTMALSEVISTQWDDLLALALVLIIIPFHMFWCLGNPNENWRHRKLSRQRRLPLSVRLKHFAQLQVLYFYLLLVLLISMYSCSATLQDYVSREVYRMTGKWLEEFIDRRLQELWVW